MKNKFKNLLSFESYSKNNKDCNCEELYDDDDCGCGDKEILTESIKIESSDDAYDVFYQNILPTFSLEEIPSSCVDNLKYLMVELYDDGVIKTSEDMRGVLKDLIETGRIWSYCDGLNERKNIPSDEKLWQKALRWVKGTRHGNSSSVRHNGETHQSPNDGKGFEIYPSAYANSAAAKKYREWGGTWIKNENLNEDLRDWHAEEWVRIDTQGNIAGECGSMPKGKRMQRCLPKKKAQSMTKAERAATVAKKVKGDKKGKQWVRNTEKATVSNEDREKARK